MPRPVFLIILANPPEDDRSHHWALFIPEPHRPSSGKYITIGRSSLSGSGSYFRIYKHGYDLDAVLRTPTWDEQGEPIGTEQRRNLPRYERLYLGSIPDNMVVDLVREDQSTGEDESNDVFVVEAEKVEVPGYVSRGDSLVCYIPLRGLLVQSREEESNL